MVLFQISNSALIFFIQFDVLVKFYFICICLSCHWFYFLHFLRFFNCLLFVYVILPSICFRLFSLPQFSRCIFFNLVYHLFYRLKFVLVFFLLFTFVFIRTFPSFPYSVQSSVTRVPPFSYFCISNLFYFSIYHVPSISFVLLLFFQPIIFFFNILSFFIFTLIHLPTLLPFVIYSGMSFLLFNIPHLHLLAGSSVL